MIKRRAMRRAPSICWDCDHSVPCLEERRGCRWSIEEKPVPGWEAIKTGTSYRVIRCPKFRKSEGGRDDKSRSDPKNG